MPSIGVVIPAWNEAARIGRTVSAAAAISGVSEVIVVDDGSTDDTADIAWQAGAHVLRLPTNRGKGQALHEGIQRCKCDIILMLDADLEETAIAAEALLKPVLNEQADMAIAQFPRCKPAGFGIVRTLAQGGIRMLTGLKLQSPLSGQRAVRRIIFDQVTLAPGWETEVALTIDAVRCGFRVLEVPVAFRHRSTGRDWKGFVHRGRQFGGVAKALLLRLFTAPGACMC
ncbi:MAG TPA: glycosyltransferase family 2 protein [Firmicutes bacterium]|jgi:glycosyltransferase involved in cell wall biosynthesis|nr:glycosyltransferase family 2 protein [Bacillota bacterium]